MKIAVTLLDSYRYWKETEFMDPEREHQALQEIIARIQHKRLPKSEPMLKGIAFANVCEHPQQYFHSPSGNYRCDGFEFLGVDVQEFMLNIPSDALKEVWMPQYKHNGNRLVARADVMKDNVLGDVKLISKAFNAKKYDSYEESIQWQAECLMADCEKFVYYVTQGKHRKSDDVITLHNTQVFPFYRSEATDRRVLQLMNDFAAFAEPYLTGEEA